MPKKVLLGFSGGVDSAIAAHLLRLDGYAVTGLFMRNWDSLANNDYQGNPNINNEQCPQEVDYEDALKAAQTLGIELLRSDFIDEYWNKVFQQFIEFYRQGMTPNPDVFCNKYIKFDAFLKYALEHGYDYIAMGHYAKKGSHPDGTFSLMRPFDLTKDQTYFLSQISQEQLKYALFPLSNILKTTVRELAQSLGLELAQKKDSTGVCFIGERHFKEFLTNYIPQNKGPIIDLIAQKKVGEHDGVNFYTIGQSRGLGIGGIKDGNQKGYVVAQKDLPNNTLYVVPKGRSDLLMVDQIVIRDLNWLNQPPTLGNEYHAQFRYRQMPGKLRIAKISDTELVVAPIDPFMAITPGQIAVIYDGDTLVGSGIIYETYRQGQRIN